MGFPGAMRAKRGDAEGIPHRPVSPGPSLPWAPWTLPSPGHRPPLPQNPRNRKATCRAGLSTPSAEPGKVLPLCSPGDRNQGGSGKDCSLGLPPGVRPAPPVAERAAGGQVAAGSFPPLVKLSQRTRRPRCSERPARGQAHLKATAVGISASIPRPGRPAAPHWPVFAS